MHGIGRDRRGAGWRRFQLVVAVALACGAIGATPAVAASDLAVTLTAPAAGFVVGDSGSLTVTVSNFGPDALTGTTAVTDTLPAGLTLLSAAGVGWSCASGPTVACATNASAAAGTALPAIGLTVAVDAAALPSVLDTVTVANGSDGNPANDSAQRSIAVRAQQDVGIALGAVARAQVGQDVTLPIRMTNAGAQPTSGPVTVDDALPPSVDVVSAQGTGWSCALAPAAAGHVRCTTSAFVAGGWPFPPLAITVRPTAAAAPAFANSATVAMSGDQNAANDSATRTVPLINPDLTASLVPTQLTVGQRARFMLSARVVGSSRLVTHPTTLTATLPDSLELDGASGDGWTCTIMPQVSCTTTRGVLASVVWVRVRALPAAYPAVQIRASVHNDLDYNVGDDSTSATFTVVRPALRPLSARVAWAPRRGRSRAQPTRVAALQVTGGVRGAALTVRCVAGCRRATVLARARVGHGPARLRFVRPLAVRAGRVLAIAETLRDHQPLTQRYGFVRAGRHGWRLRRL